MPGILWLASYPKSGNTWLRIFIENLFQNTTAPAAINDLGVVKLGDAMVPLYEQAAGRPLSGLSEPEIHALREPLQRQWASGRETPIVKTHNALMIHDGRPLIHLEHTAGAIYIVRNPFDLTLSLADHYSLSIPDAMDMMCADFQRTPTTGAAVFQVIGNWTDHYRSWFSVPNFQPLLLRYEDMARTPTKTFGRFVKYMGLPQNTERLKRAIKNSSFSEVSRQEASQGFKERVRADQRFFRAGKVGGWRGVLNEGQIARIVDAHRPLLTELKYIDPKGRPKV